MSTVGVLRPVPAINCHNSIPNPFLIPSSIDDIGIKLNQGLDISTVKIFVSVLYVAFDVIPCPVTSYKFGPVFFTFAPFSIK